MFIPCSGIIKYASASLWIGAYTKRLNYKISIYYIAVHNGFRPVIKGIIKLIYTKCNKA